VLLDIENLGIGRWKCVATMCANWRFQAVFFNFLLTLTSSCANFRPTMLFDSKDMRIPLKFHIYYICNVRFKCFRFHVRISISGWTRIELCTGRCWYQRRWLRHPKKQTQQRWIYFQRWCTLLHPLPRGLMSLLSLHHVFSPSHCRIYQHDVISGLEKPFFLETVLDRGKVTIYKY